MFGVALRVVSAIFAVVTALALRNVGYVAIFTNHLSNWGSIPVMMAESHGLRISGLAQG